MTASGPYEHVCHVCGAPHAPFGFGWPSRGKDRPDEEILWGCASHREDVERINERRTGHKASRA